jgi:hypothetical protein
MAIDLPVKLLVIAESSVAPGGSDPIVSGCLPRR